MLILDATPGGAQSNSYVTRGESDFYHESHFYAEAWAALTPSRKDVALVHATRLLDEHVEWHGSKTNRTQALRWPRTGVEERDGSGGYYDALYGYTIDPNSIPVWLKNATAEMARHLSMEDRTVEPDMLEFSAMTIGPLSLVKDKGSRKEVLPESVRAMVTPYGIVQTLAGLGMAKLVRA